MFLFLTCVPLLRTHLPRVTLTYLSVQVGVMSSEEVGSERPGWKTCCGAGAGGTAVSALEMHQEVDQLDWRA